jgi:thioester reductase-like protein
VAYEPTADDVLPSGSVPIGRPIANTRVYVLDRSGELAPIGLPGELVIGGDGVTRGYLNAPDLTAARFVPDRFRGQGQMYRTGDRVRWRPDGQIEFLGRFDEQVKVRGFRVEPGEIETALGQHPAVRAAAVVPQPDASGQLQLVAYVTLNDDSSADADALLAHLRGRVPTYLLPAAIAVLPELPRTTSGKIDRRALAAHGPAGIVSARPYVAPRTPTEETVAATWADLFGVETIGAEDNFFDLGGHSLMAVQLAARMSRTLDRQIPVRAVILYPTVAALAQAFDDGIIGDESNDELSSTSASGAALLDSLGPHVAIERRSIENLSVSGEIAPVQSAAIGYLPSSLLPFAGLKAEDVIRGWLGNRPIVSGIFDWELGRIATVLIPRFDSQLYDDQQDTVAAITDALRLAKRLGAATVSLTGLLPSATDYGRAVERAIAGQGLPQITTGHATTTAAVVLAIRRILSEARRDLARERVALIGLGSIGSTVLRLLLRSTPHPAELILCDVFAKREVLRELEHAVRAMGFQGPVRVCEAQATVPPDVYSATLIVGATNAADILDVDRLRPGTLIVDDSAPHLFRPDHAVRRLRHRGDILFTEGGTLWARETIRQIVHLPAEIEPFARLLPQDVLPMHDPRQITGCIVSSLLSTRDTNLKPTVGLVDADLAAKHLDALTELGFTAAQLHCEGFALDAETIAKFRDRFGESPVGRTQPTTMSAREFDWRAEAVLDPAISAAGLPPVRSGEPRTILLTGATGFLGAFLLGDLLELTSARIVCLVRAGSESEALKRIQRNLAQYLIEASDKEVRIVPLAGDLAQPRLGLSEEQFARLAQDVDVIYHNGAQVHFLHPYSTLKPANVLGTQSVLRLATTARLKPVHFVSTLSVLSGLSKGRLADEIDRNETPEWLENGYAQSKWVAERLVWSAMDRGIPATILRPGRIVWHSRTGALNQDDVFTRALRACIQIAAVPALDSVLEMTPVDYISRATIAIARNPQAPGRAYHLFNRQYVRLQDLLNWVREAGYPLEVLPPDQWLARVQSSATHDAQDALAGLLPLLANGVPFLGDEANSGSLLGPNFDGRNTQAILAGTGVESAAIGPETVAVYLARLVADGLLNPANKHKKPAAASAANGQTRRRGNRSRSHGTK